MNFIKRNQSLNFVIFFFLFSLFVTIASELAMGLLSTSFVKVLGKTLMLCLAAIALDLVWGYCGILSLCLLYTSDAADEGLGVDLGGRRII